MSIHTGPVLVVEDIANIRDLIAFQLKSRGYVVVTATDGQDALEKIAAEKPSVVITDILMPRVDGFALAHKLRTNPPTASIPIIFLSATYVSAEDECFALGLGAMRFLPKPVDTNELYIAIADALTGQGQSQPPAPMEERAFYAGYRQRLESKLQQKAGQIARNEQQLLTVPFEQRATYEKLIAETEAQYAELQRELTVLAQVMQAVG